MQTAVSYQRWSTPEQGNHDSQKRQDDLVTAYCKEKNLTLLETRRDEGMSSFRSANSNRGKLKQLRDDLESGRLKCNFVLLEDWDRLTRDTPYDAEVLINQLILTGVTIVTLNDREEYSKEILRANPYKLQKKTNKAITSHEESLKKSSRLKSSWVGRRAIADRAPITGNCPAWLQPVYELVRNKKVLVSFDVIEEKADIVRDIYRMAAEGVSVEGMCKLYNEKGTLTLTGSKNWYRQQINRVLSAKSVIGILEPMVTEYERDDEDVQKRKRIPLPEVADYYPKIVDIDVAKSVWRIIGKGSVFKSTGRPALITSALAKCGSCGAAMTFNIKGRYRYIVCSKTRVKACTDIKLIVYKEIEGVLLNNLADILDHHSTDEDFSQESREANAGRQALEELELQAGRLVDAIRVHGFNKEIG